MIHIDFIFIHYNQLCLIAYPSSYKTDERVEDQAFSYLFNRNFEEELESHLQELRAEAFVEIKEFD